MATLFNPDTKLKDDILQLSRSGNPVPPKVALLQLLRISFPHEEPSPRPSATTWAWQSTASCVYFALRTNQRNPESTNAAPLTAPRITAASDSFIAPSSQNQTTNLSKALSVLNQAWPPIQAINDIH
ncbi:hypothetical protein MYU51_008917 [Penicillium brevicompactum]|uniref:uncharacterized protein n=1 Tax=Penicillium brevicompactum TaxID=5074 RepID=UPI002541A625|nr:uncharacterized protein N7506_006651 [Penicillium brevicompactum]KAJ5332868.1 hypothetical protein N7506_006651 [Penicillium brevicompactum]